MKLNPKNILFGNDTEKKPVLLAVTPPRTGERTLLGVENLLQSIAVPEPFSLELAGDMDGVTLMARCLDDKVVRGQLTAHYPQARIQKVDPGDDPLRLDEGEQAWSITLRADGPEYVPLRTFRDDDLLDPGSDPLIALMGALSALQREGAGGDAAAAALPRPRLVAAPHGEGPQAARHGAARAVLHLPDQAVADGRRDDGRARHRRAGGPQGLPVGAGRRDMEGGAPWRRNGPGAGRRRLGMVAVEEGPQARGRPSAHQGEGLPHSLRRRATGRRRPVLRRRAAAGQGASGNGVRRLPPLRQPRRGEIQGRQGPARRSRPGDAAPGRPRPVREAERPGRPRGGLPLAPARRRRRDAPGGAVRREGAQPLGQGRQGRRAGRRHHRGSEEGDPLPRRPAPASPPLHPPRRRHDAARREDRGDRPAGTDRRQVGLLRAAQAAAERPHPGHAPGPHGRRRAAQARPQGAVEHRRAGSSRRGTRGGTSRGGRQDMDAVRDQRRHRPALRAGTGGPRRRAAPGAGTRTGRRARRRRRRGTGVGHSRPHAARHPSAPPRSAPWT